MHLTFKYFDSSPSPLFFLSYVFILIFMFIFAFLRLSIPSTLYIFLTMYLFSRARNFLIIYTYPLLRVSQLTDFFLPITYSLVSRVFAFLLFSTAVKSFSSTIYVLFFTYIFPRGCNFILFLHSDVCYFLLCSRNILVSSPPPPPPQNEFSHFEEFSDLVSSVSIYSPQPNLFH